MIREPEENGGFWIPRPRLWDNIKTDVKIRIECCGLKSCVWLMGKPEYLVDTKRKIRNFLTFWLSEFDFKWVAFYFLCLMMIMMMMMMVILMMTVIENFCNLRAINHFIWSESGILIVNVPESSIIVSIDAYAIEGIRFVGRKSIDYRSCLYVFHRNSPF